MMALVKAALPKACDKFNPAGIRTFSAAVRAQDFQPLPFHRLGPLFRRLTVMVGAGFGGQRSFEMVDIAFNVSAVP